MATPVGSRIRRCSRCGATLATTFTGDIDSSDEHLLSLMDFMETAWHECRLGDARQQKRTIRIEEENEWDRYW